jgi:hypothetical protein
MKKILIGVLCMVSAFIYAMDKDNEAPKVLYTSAATREYPHQTFKGYSYLDVAYATIPDSVIDMETQDPLQKKTLKEEAKNIGSPFDFARVVTPEKIYYCSTAALHKALGLTDELPDLTTFKDPSNQNVALSGIDYYAYGDCSRCKNCIRLKKQLYKELYQQLKKAKPDADRIISQGANGSQCEDPIMVRTGGYDDLRDICRINDKNERARLFSSLAIPEKGGAVQRDTQIQNVFFKLFITTIEARRHGEQCGAKLKEKEDQAVLDELEQGISKLHAFEDWVEGRHIDKSVKGAISVILIFQRMSLTSGAQAFQVSDKNEERQAYIATAFAKYANRIIVDE